MLKILQARLHQYVNQEYLDVQVGFRKGRGRYQIANTYWIIAKPSEFQETNLGTSLSGVHMLLMEFWLSMSST